MQLQIPHIETNKITDFFADPTTVRVIKLIIGFVVIWILVKIIQKNLVTRIRQRDKRHSARKISAFIGYFMVIVLLISLFSYKIKDFTVALGVAGAGIAFALQEVIASFAGWLAIMFGKFYKTGERVELGGIIGDVMDISVLRTTIMQTGVWVDGDLYNGRIVRVANSFIFKEPVYNYSSDFPFLWDEIKIPIQYGTPYEKMIRLLDQIGHEIADDMPLASKKKWSKLQHRFFLEDAQTTPMVSVAANEKWVEFTLRYIVHYKKRRATKTTLFLQIIRAVEETKGEIKIASPVINITSNPEIKTNINLNEK